jgi:hypothetical protein
MSDQPNDRLLDVFEFMRKEHEQLEISTANRPDELAIVEQLQRLYDTAVPKAPVLEDDMPIFQLLILTHYYFLRAVADMLRCHLSESFGSARIAIDAAMIAAQIIADRASQIAYVKRTKPFDNYARHIGNLIKDNKPLPHPLVAPLFALQKKLSTFSSHADVGSFIHRLDISREPGNRRIVVQYFQFADDENQRQMHNLSLFHAFVMVLDVFADFLIVEHRSVPEGWRNELHTLGISIERRHGALKATLPREFR